MTADGATAASKLADNPFYVLGVSVDASRIEVEREAQKLLGMIELGFEAMATYDTPLGPRARTAELVRAAVAALRDPYRRLVAELWARHAPQPQVGARLPEGGASEAASTAPEAHSGSATPPTAANESPPRPLPSAGLRRRLGWRP